MGLRGEYIQSAYIDIKKEALNMGEGPNKRKGLGIKGMFFKILIVAVICMIIPLVVSAFLITSQATEVMEKTVFRNLQDLSVKENAALKGYIGGQRTVALSVANNPIVIQEAKKYKETGKIDKELQKNVSVFLGSLEKNANNLYENLFVTYGSTGYADCLNNETLHDVAEENYYIQCQENGFYFGNNVSPVTGNPVYVIAYAIKDSATGEMLGTVNSSIDMGKLSQTIITDENYDIAILDMEGNLICSRNTDSILNFNLSESSPEQWNNIQQQKTGHFSYISE